ncbi:zinc transporter ZIP13 homolog [Daphnia pulex]|uniref:zinc transporter ZIP13 homolog n=1 Tax=Daphnia pulex TaxID=6669 RepID=UPI001EDF32ED|nr:zinc transporter ZIP13 homolog [Daphnia pulex]XP_046438569.1 zinc transporter ZIP13 homolog [Daphnia pulex]
MDSEWHPWIGSVAGAMLVGLSGIVPLLVFPDPSKLKNPSSSTPLEQSPNFRLLLSFAVGGLLGDVFLHLLPEAWHLIRLGNDSNRGQVQLGMWLIAGLFAFALLERLLSSTAEAAEDNESSRELAQQEDEDSDTQNNNDPCDKKRQEKKDFTKRKNSAPPSQLSLLNPFHGMSSKQVTGYLNLLANGIDNFTHGLAVAGSFLVSTRVGLLTTAAILLHEIPHEVADFAILLRAGFGRWDAAKAQLGTATIGIAGAMTALISNGSDLADGRITSWILPFTAGGFLHIALVTVVPELLEESHPKQSFLQLVFVLAGIAATAGVSLIVD